MPSSQTGKYKRPEWHKYLWIPVGICFVIVLLFILGVLGPKQDEAALPQPDVSLTPNPPEATPSALESQTPEIKQTPGPQDTPGNEGTPEPQALYLKPINPPQTRYEAALTLYEDQNRFHGNMRVHFKNTTGQELYELVFHLHPNAFKERDSAGSQAESRSYPELVFSHGEAIISSVSLNGEISYFNLSDDGLLLSVPFMRPLAPGESIEALIEFAVDVPVVNARFGKTQLGYQLGSFLPILAVYQDGDWVRRGYVSMGDSFYSEVADYAVALKYPERFTLACTGSISQEERSGGMKTSYAAASSVREFACMLFESPVVETQTLGDVSIISYALSEGSAKAGAAHAKNALELYENLLGPYPYETLSVTQAELVTASGMEYPSFVMIQRELYLAGKEIELEMTIAHEVAHQYFYALVGNDPISAPWLDEALTTYLGMLPFEQREDKSTFNALREAFFHQYSSMGGRIDGDLESYADVTEYSLSVYYRGGAMYDALRQTLGDETFFAALRQYIVQNAFKVATAPDIIAAFEGASGGALEDFFEAWLAAPDRPESDAA